ncbi:hypothetical protein E9993_07655 [Labilibacter sediminis]|nr:hypothetical protein E9993_07655 [Labilibacter sediminis]
MFKTIYLKNLRNGEFVQYNENLLSILGQNNPEALLINDQYNALNQLQETLTSIFKQDQGSAITKELTEIDARRDNAFTGISTVIKGYTYHYDDNLRNAAETLNESLENYGAGLTRLNYQTQTSFITDIISKWKSEQKQTAAVELLKLNDWFSLLETENNLFDERFVARIQESAKTPEMKVIDVREAIINKYSEILKYISAYSTINGEEAYAYVISQINALNEQYNKTLSARKSSTTTAETSAQ